MKNADNRQVGSEQQSWSEDLERWEGEVQRLDQLLESIHRAVCHHEGTSKTHIQRLANLGNELDNHRRPVHELYDGTKLDRCIIESNRNKASSVAIYQYNHER